MKLYLATCSIKEETKPVIFLNQWFGTDRAAEQWLNSQELAFDKQIDMHEADKARVIELLNTYA